MNISSGIASIPFPLYTLYSASKVSSQVFSGFPKSREVTAHVICVPYRCLWKDFPKAFKVNTKIKGSLFRYFRIILKGFFLSSDSGGVVTLVMVFRQWLRLVSPLE